MTKRQHILNLIIAASVFSGMVNFSGCSLNSVVDELRDPEKLSQELHEKPRFWYDSVAYSEKDGLYTLSNEFFQRKPYNNLLSFGDNVLLVGQGTYINQLNDLIDDERDDHEDQEFEYSFDLYSPWKNSIVASINHEDITCNAYQVVGANLFLINTNSKTINIYNKDLEFIQRIDLKNYGDLADYRFYPSYDDEHFLAYNYIDRTLVQIDRTTNKSDLIDFDMYNTNLEAVSDDGKEFMVSGVDEDSLHYEIQTVDTATLEKTNVIRGSNYYSSDVNDDGYLTSVDSVWLYHSNKSDTNVRFEASDVTNSRILPDGSFILSAEGYWEEGEESHTVSYSHISADGEELSSFSFDCGDYSQPGYIYFSSDYAYLPDANCVMFLNYTTDVNPYILVWDLNVQAENNAIDVNFVEDSGIVESDTPAIDFGDLEEANNTATRLEEKYGVDIYIGEEVPDTIDVFNTLCMNDSDIVNESLNTLEAILSCYPENFFSQLCYGDLEKVEIYLSGDITSNSEDTIAAAGGFVTVDDSRIIMVLDTNQNWYWNYTVHHEISHMIDRRLDFRIMYAEDSMYSEEKWCSYNPEGFDYLYSYSDYVDNPDYLSNSDYFIDDYGTTYPTEDRAEIFGKAMEDYMNDNTDTAYYQDNSPIMKKLYYYSKIIREGFNTTGWDQVMPWEKMLYR